MLLWTYLYMSPSKCARILLVFLGVELLGPSCIFSLIGSCQTVFQSGCINVLHSFISSLTPYQALRMITQALHAFFVCVVILLVHMGDWLQAKQQILLNRYPTPRFPVSQLTIEVTSWDWYCREEVVCVKWDSNVWRKYLEHLIAKTYSFIWHKFHNL